MHRYCNDFGHHTQDTLLQFTLAKRDFELSTLADVVKALVLPALFLYMQEKSAERGVGNEDRNAMQGVASQVGLERLASCLFSHPSNCLVQMR